VAAGLPDLALADLRWGRNQYPENDAALCYVMSRIQAGEQDYDAAISSLRRAFPDYNSRPRNHCRKRSGRSCFQYAIWDNLRTGLEAKMDPSLVWAPASRRLTKKRGRANARGLMQVLPSTGRRLAKQSKIARYNTNKLYQAETNILLGTRYFALFLQQYGKPELALAAYNAGDSRVKRWLQEWGIWTWRICRTDPFAETGDM
jgi:soluble lytic murein transglycosylase-like protein